MSREIKFRAWDGKKIINEITPYFTGEGILCVGRDGYDRTAYDIRTSIDCIALSIMQYTGIKDKNGVEIYDGDILKRSSKLDSKNNEWIGVVKENIYGGQCLYYKEYTSILDMQIASCIQEPQTAVWINENCEVIGNIYENSELLGSER